MKKIATHDSATGEKGEGFLSWLLTPFAKTQSKTIKEQYDAGSRMFDLRVKLINFEIKCAHGLWHTKRTAYSILKEINNFKDRCYVTITYEGGDEELNIFSHFADAIQNEFTNIIYGGFAIKYGKKSKGLKIQYDYIKSYPKGWPINKQGFLPLDGRSWHTYLPIPWLWKKIYHNKPEFNEDHYIYVDFL